MLKVLGIIVDYFLCKQELTMYLYWRRLFNDTNITVKKVAFSVNNNVIISFYIKILYMLQVVWFASGFHV